MRKVVFLLLLACFQISYAQVQKKALFMGNSYTSGMPEVVASIAKSLGDSLYHLDGSGGQAIKDHATSQQSLSAIASNNWDYVVLQCQSQEAAFRPSYVNQNVFPYAKILADRIHTTPGCMKPVFYMTWGRKNGDQSNCQNYAPMCSYETMQMELRKNYLKMGYDNNAFISPAGMAWRYAINQWPSIDLYDSDESHASDEGMYLTACTFYAVIFGKSPVGASYHGNISKTDADSLQKAAALTVFDSLKTWNIEYDDASNSVSYFIHSDTIDFLSTNSNLDSVVWHFGDGTMKSGNNISYVYGKADTFTVAVQSFKGCLISDTTFQIITTLYKPQSTIGISEIMNRDFKVYPNPTHGKVTIEWTKNSPENVEFSIMDIHGKEVFKTTLIQRVNPLIIDHLEPGLYYYLLDQHGRHPKFGSLVVN